MGHRRLTDANEPALERSGVVRSGGPAHPVSTEFTPVLHLQATAGNAAVASLLRRDLRRPVVQGLWDTDDETDDSATNDSPTEIPADETAESEDSDASGGEATPADAGPDASGVDAVQSAVEADLDPDAVVEQLAPYATQEGELGDFPIPSGPTAQALFIQRDPPPGQEGPTTREGSAGDVIKAFMPYLKPVLEQLKANVLEALRKLKAGEAIAAAIVTAPIIVAPLTQPGPRRLALDQLDGTDVTFGVIPNLKIKPQITDGELRGGTVTYDLAPALRKLGVPW